MNANNKPLDGSDGLAGSLGSPLGPEPEGFLVRAAEVREWCPWITDYQWKLIRPTLSTYTPPGGAWPYYRREEVRAKLVRPVVAGEVALASQAAL
jgi:hypothetical protein